MNSLRMRRAEKLLRTVDAGGREGDDSYQRFPAGSTESADVEIGSALPSVGRLSSMAMTSPLARQASCNSAVISAPNLSGGRTPPGERPCQEIMTSISSRNCPSKRG